MPSNYLLPERSSLLLDDAVDGEPVLDPDLFWGLIVLDVVPVKKKPDITLADSEALAVLVLDFFIDFCEVSDYVNWVVAFGCVVHFLENVLNLLFGFLYFSSEVLDNILFDPAFL